MRKTLSLASMFLLGMQLFPAASGADDVVSQIAAMPAGTKIEVRLKNKQTLRGTTGPVSNSEFTLVDARGGERQIAFDDVASVQEIRAKSHLRRNILIGIGVGVAALGITAAVLLRCGPFGCGKHPF